MTIYAIFALKISIKTMNKTKLRYQSPKLKIVDFKVEVGFAGSNESLTTSTFDWGGGTSSSNDDPLTRQVFGRLRGDGSDPSVSSKDIW